MAVKRTRIEALRSLLASEAYSHQEDLLKALRGAGYVISQSTLSRDLLQLKVVKETGIDGVARYVLPKNKSEEAAMRRQRVTQSFGFLSANYSGNILMLKTLHGYANSLAAEIDDHNIPDVLGSLAGDDTVLLILREGAQRDIISEHLKQLIPHFERES